MAAEKYGSVAPESHQQLQRTQPTHCHTNRSFQSLKGLIDIYKDLLDSQFEFFSKAYTGIALLATLPQMKQNQHNDNFSSLWHQRLSSRDTLLVAQILVYLSI